MTTPPGLRINPDLIRSLGSSWHRIADSTGSLDPGGAVTSWADSVSGSATADVMAGATGILSNGVARTAARLHAMAVAARRTADSAEAADDAFAEKLRRIDGGR